MASSSPPPTCDILIVGGGNAGLSAALSAAESGVPNVVIIDKCPEDWAGGNSYFTAGATRVVHAGLDDLLPLVNNVDAELAGKIDLPAYTAEDFRGDMDRICLGRSHPELSRILVEESNAAVKWLAGKGVRYQLSFNRQAYLVDGRYKFWGGLALKTQDGGKGLIDDEMAAAQRAGVKMFFETPATRLHRDPLTGAVNAVSIEHKGQPGLVKAKAVILAAGGFEANPRMRAQYLGPGWDLAHVRGTPHNTGDGLAMAARDVDAQPAGHWSGCHATCWDARAPADTGDRGVGNEFTKSGYPLGVMVNADGARFVDEGVDFRNYTYAVFGRQILRQPGGVAWQVYDQRAIPWLRGEEYRDGVVKKIRGATIAELAQECARDGLKDPRQFVATLEAYNAATRAHMEEHPERAWDPAVKDGVSTGGALPLAKSNWALPIDRGPFLAVKVTGGVTFTFGGLAVEPATAGVVSSTTQKVIPGLFSVGEMLGGLFYGNYPGGSGLTSGTVFGRRAGRAAAEVVRRVDAGLVEGGKARL